jgi:MFS family permease
MAGRHRAASQHAVDSRQAPWRLVLGNREYAGLWAAHALSLAGDQLARIALAVLVFDRTGSAAATAAAYAITFAPWLLGGPLLAGLGDRYPRRVVLIGCDLASAGLVAVMALPGVSLLALCGLLFAVTILAAPFRSARSALVRDLFPGGSEHAESRYALAATLTTMTTQAAQIVGFAVGGVLVAVLGARPALAVDAATFALSAVLVRLTVHTRRPPTVEAGRASARGPRAGVRVVFGDPWLRSLTLLAWLDAFLVVPAGVVVPYIHDRGGGPSQVGLLLAAIAAGTTLGMLALGRLDTQGRLRLMYPLATVAGLPLAACALNPDPAVTTVLWAAAGAASAYQLAANIAFVAAVPNTVRAQAFGLVATGMAAGQGTAIIAAGALAEILAPHLVVAIAGMAATGFAALLAARAPAASRAAAAV